MAETANYDLVIIGSGPGGYVAAIRAGQLGLKTLIVEKDEKFGGTCLHVGCIPTKDLLLNSEVYDYFKNAKEYGIVCKEFSIDWAAVQARKTKVVTRLVKGIEFLFKKNKVESIQGYGRLSGPGRITVTDAKGRPEKSRLRRLSWPRGRRPKRFRALNRTGKPF